GAPGACGSTNTNSELVVSLYTADYAGGASCEREIEVSGNGASFFAKVVGECPGCGTHDVDLSPAAFQVLAPVSAGLASPVVWNFV
ncbi:RlpA-like double-psi beta-barrel-protein domain-containing protein-containing protein, partial [Panaeolus papilionaceus]